MIDRQELADWLKLTLAPGIGGETQRKLLTAFGLPEAVFAGGRAAAREVVQRKADALFDFEPGDAVDRTVSWLSDPNHHFITLADVRYPPALLEIPDPPVVLYVRGNPDLLTHTGIGIVGSRNATPLGMQTAEGFANALAAQRLCIISGLALGIDTAAHRGALTAKGKTIAVIGTGTDRLYPARNKELALSIAEHGAIVSEFPLGTPAHASNFPRRNRLISGLSRGILVVEAALESGSLITARLAAEQGRDVFAIPGSIHSPLARGCHRLIKQGAKLVETAQDILDELAPSAGQPNQYDSSLTAGNHLDFSDSPVLNALSSTALTLDDLQSITGFATDDLLGELLSLELDGRIAPLPGSRYQRLN